VAHRRLKDSSAGQAMTADTRRPLAVDLDSISVYQIRREAAIRALEATMRVLKLAAIPLSLYAAAIPELPEYRIRRRKHGKH
jgi:uncharacterized protein YecA (UPF0149 family)